MIKTNLKLLVLFFLLLLLSTNAQVGCGEDIKGDEGLFDRWDACERILSLCDLSRDKMNECIEQVMDDYPYQLDRVIFVNCIREIKDCQEIETTCFFHPGFW